MFFCVRVALCLYFTVEASSCSASHQKGNTVFSDTQLSEPKLAVFIFYQHFLYMLDLVGLLALLTALDVNRLPPPRWSNQTWCGTAVRLSLLLLEIGDGKTEVR